MKSTAADDATPGRESKCLDCGAPLTQPSTGRPKAYCDATCRKNAARFRAYQAWKVEHDKWQEREADRLATHLAAQARWDATPAPAMPSWCSYALADDWAPRQGWDNWDRERKAQAIGPRPGRYYTPREDPAPARVPDYRSGTKTSYGW